MSNRGVIFDMDGVLVDSYQAHFQALKRLGQDHGLEVTEEMFAKGFGWTTRELIRRWWGPRVSDSDISLWDSQKELYYRQILHQRFPAMDGASELLAELAREGFKLAIGSSGCPDNVRAVLELLNNSQVFTAIVHGMEVTRGKPDPEVFLKAAEKLSMYPRYCLVIEDAVAGVQAAHQAGMSVIAITGTTDRNSLAEADLVVDSHRQISAEIIEQLINRRTSAVVTK